MTQPCAIVVVIDRLGAGYLSPYGNTWLETPALNRLASQSMLWENAFTDCPTLEGFYRAVGSGRHWLSRNASDANTAENLIIERLNNRGVRTVFVGDDPRVAELPMAAQFSHRIIVPSVDVRGAAASFDDTQMAQTFAAAIDYFSQLEPPFLMWLHLQGVAGPWDAPREYRERFADEEDPIPPDFVDLPDRVLARDTDPDEILGVAHALAGQVVLLDLCMDTFQTTLDSMPWRSQTLSLITSPRGYPVGEHGALGACGDGLHEEVIHVPLMIRLPDQRYAMRRLHALVHTPDLATTLADWFTLDDGPSRSDGVSLLRLAGTQDVPPRDAVVSVFEGQRSLRTPSWFLRADPEGLTRLFVKPDDRWEINEVSSRCGDVVASGLQALADFERHVQENSGGDSPRLLPLLLEPAE